MLHCILPHTQRGTPAEEAVDAHNNQPHIVRFVDSVGDIPPSHFIAIEQELLLECRSLDRALFLTVASHFSFQYGILSQSKDVLFYLQEKVL